MTPRQVILDAISFRRPAYVPWSWSATIVCHRRLQKYLGKDDLTDFYRPHMGGVGEGCVRVAATSGDYVTDIYGVTWDRTVDKDIGTPCDWPIKEPADLARYTFPDADDPAWYADCPAALARNSHLFNSYSIGFALFERAWTLRGMENLLMDMVERPSFVDDLLDRITEHNMVQIRHALQLDIDGVYFGDDYGMQTGLIMGISHWRRFIKPRLATMFAPVRRAGKFVSMHSCGCVESLFDDLVEIGLNLFNPFQPEVMDVFTVKKRLEGRLAFHGGLSSQRLLPFGSEDDVRRETRRLIELGANGGLIIAPSHAAPGDIPPQNLVAMMETLRDQAGYRAAGG